MGASGGGFTFLFGVTRPFDATKLAALYPGGVDEYIGKFESATASARADEYLLDEDISEIVGVARASWRG
jgi:Alpha/beta hydrolase domain